MPTNTRGLWPTLLSTLNQRLLHPLLMYLHFLRTRMHHEILRAPLEPVLHASAWRLRWLGIIGLVGQPLTGIAWNMWLPQPYENLGVRLALSLMALPFLLPAVSNDAAGKNTSLYFSLLCWLHLPFFFSWMYWMNGGNFPWLSSVAAMLLIYYHLTDWRLATVGILLGGVCSAGLASLMLPNGLVIENPKMATFIFVFWWSTAVLLGASSANLRRVVLRRTLTTMGIMAQELKTPLATVAVVADSLQSQAQNPTGMDRALYLDRMGSQLHNMVRQMHNHIDTQLANARLLQLAPMKERVCASELLHDVVGRFPYRTPAERQCVSLRIRQDFLFLSSQVQFAQLIDNLLKNAFQALRVSKQAPTAGDIRIEVWTRKDQGYISIIDKGCGMSPHLLTRIFEPFYSGPTGTGHGLGLSFCQRVAQAANGAIYAKSQSDKGSTFTCELPIAATLTRTTAMTKRRNLAGGQ